MSAPKNKPGTKAKAPNSKSSPKSSASSKPAASRKGSSRKGLLIGIGVAVVALLAGWLSQFLVNDGGGGKADGGSANATVEGGGESVGDPQLMKLARRDAGDPFARGDRDAPVVMIEYADFGCSFCGKFARDTEPKLVKDYVDKGVLRIEWRNFPVFGKGSERAALAGWAAGKQGRFWQFYKAVYADEGNEKNAFGDGHLHDIAREAGVRDMDRFDRDRASDAAKKYLAQDQNEAYSLGASATPAFLVNGQPIAGAQPDATFTDAIDRAAKAAKTADRDGKQGGTE